ncbi:unnamed protein product [Musa acuminata var. zebrina]
MRSIYTQPKPRVFVLDLPRASLCVLRLELQRMMAAVSKILLGSLLLAGVIMGLVTSSEASVYDVGGRDGWVPNPSESYDGWAGRNRFLVNDKLVFRYRKDADSVLVVTKQDYDACNGGNPIQKLEGGDSEFKLDRSGPFFFISGTPGNCQKGQKLQVVVLAVRNVKPAPSPPAPPPAIPPSPLPPSERPTSPPAPPPSLSSNSSSGTGTQTTPSPSPIPSHPSHSSSLAGLSTVTLGLAAMILGGAFVY